MNIKKFLTLLTVLMAMTAHAGDNVPGNCGNGSGAGNAQCAGGQGGAGGAGGSATANSTNVNTNTATGGMSSSTSAGGSVGNTSASVGNVSGGRVGNTSATVGNTIATTGAQTQNQSTDNANNASQTVTVQGDNHQAARMPVATAYAAPVTASNGTCMGSTSAGMQGMGAGISFGTTWKDDSCDMRYDAEALRTAGQPLAAIARLCQKPEIAAAMAAAGTPCPDKTVAAKTSTLAPSSAVTFATTDDPFIKIRLAR